MNLVPPEVLPDKLQEETSRNINDSSQPKLRDDCACDDVFRSSTIFIVYIFFMFEDALAFSSYPEFEGILSENLTVKLPKTLSCPFNIIPYSPCEVLCCAAQRC